MQTQLREAAEQLRGRQIVGANKRIPTLGGSEQAREFCVFRIACLNPVRRLFQSVPEKRFTDAGHAGIHRRGRMCAADECNAFATQLDQMFRQLGASRKIIDSDQVEGAAFRERRHVAVEQDNRDARAAQALGDGVVHFVLIRRQIEGRKEDAGDALLDELVADVERIFRTQVRISVVQSGVAPEQRVVLGASEPRELPADQIKNVGRLPARDQQSELVGGGSFPRSAPNERPRASPPLDKFLALKIAQGANDGRARYPKTPDELRFAG